MPQGQVPVGTVTFLFTDIEGSTKLWEVHRDTMRVSLARHEETMRQAIGSSGGFVFKNIGDGFCAHSLGRQYDSSKSNNKRRRSA